MWGKSLAAALLGLPLTTGIVGLLALIWPGELSIVTLPWLLMMFPIWIAAMSLAFVCRSSLRAWLWLGGTTALCFGAIQVVKALGWAGLPA